MDPIRIFMQDIDCNLDPADVARAAEALTIQATQHFGRRYPLGYGYGATVRASTPDHAWADDDEWLLSLFSHPDLALALGYHSTTPQGLPHMSVFPLLDVANGDPWEPTASHEVLEALRDPSCQTAIQSPRDGVLRLAEVCDPVERLSYAIRVGDRDVMVSDFVLDPYFAPPSNLDGVRFDYMGRITSPGQVLDGGYETVWNGTGWEERVRGEKRPYRLEVPGRRVHLLEKRSPTW